jgi:signal transduction histidine kinase
VVCTTLKLHSQSKKIDSLLSITKTSKDVNEKISNYLKLFSLQMHYNNEDALNYINEAKKLSRTLNNDSIDFEIYRKYINHYFFNQNHDLTFKYIDSAMSYKETVSTEKLISLHNTMAQTSIFIGLLDNAIKAYDESLELSITHNLISKEIGALNGLAQVYRHKDDLTTAESYILRSIEVSQSIKDKTQEMYSTLILGHLYFDRKDYNTALRIYNTVETYLKSNKNPILQHSVNTALGRVHNELKSYDNSLLYLRENLKTFSARKNEIGVNSTRADIARTLQLQKKHVEAIDLIKENIEHAKNIKNKTLIRINYLDLSDTYEKAGYYQEALFNRKEYQKWHDSILNENNNKVINELEVKYQSEKKEKEILQLSQNKLLNEASIEKQNIRIKQLGYSFLILIFLFTTIFIIFRQRIKNKRQIELINAITDTQITEQQRIAQDLHDSVGGSLALMKTKLSAILKPDNITSNEINELINNLSQTSDEVRHISHNMMPGELVKFGMVSAIQTTLDRIQTKTLKTNLFTHNVDERLDQKKEIHLFRIFQEVIQNILKHAEANSLNVYLNKHSKSLSLMIEDDGKGFDKNIEGFGLKNIKNRVTYLNGKIKIDSNINKGTTINIQIPLAS